MWENEDSLAPARGIIRGLLWGLFIWVVCILLGVLLFAKYADAQWEVGAGQTTYGTENGVWYDSLYPFNNDTNVGSQIISLHVPGYRLSFVHLGEATNTAVWGRYELSTELANPSLSRTPQTAGSGYGDIYGLSLGKTAEWKLHQVTLGLEGGLIFYRGEWHETYWSLSDPSVKYHDDQAHFNLDVYVGAGLTYGRFFVQYRYYPRIQNGLVNNQTRQIALGVTFPFGDLQ